MSEAVTEFYDVIGPFYEFVFPEKQGKHSKQNGQRSPDSDDSNSPERGNSFHTFCSLYDIFYVSIR